MSFEILEDIDLGFKPNMHAPLITDTYGLRGTRTLILKPSSKFFLISDFKNGDSENPPTIKIKLTGDTFYSACSINCFTFDLILSNNGLKNVTISPAGKSIEDAPLYLSCRGAGFFALNSFTKSPNFYADNSSPK